MLLYESLNQPLNFLFLFLIGYGASIIFDISKYLTFLCNQNKIMQKIFDSLAITIFGVIFFISYLFLNFGEFRFYLLLSYLLGLLAERFTLGIILAKTCKFCYSKFKKFVNFIFRKKNNEIISKT